MSKRIGVLGLSTNKNIGDYLLVEATTHLLSTVADDLTIVPIDVDPRGAAAYPGLRRINRKIASIMRRMESLVFTIIASKTLQYLYQYAYWYIKLNWHYSREFRNLDALVFAGGGFIKFRTQGLNYLDEQIIKLAESRNIPVMMSAVGIEHYDESDVRCQRLKVALNKPIVKVITTRDDIDTLRNDYVKNPGTITDRVADPVLWLKDMVGELSHSRTKCIGINLINPDNFIAYGGRFSRDDVRDFYLEVIRELQARNEDFRLFTNGMAADMEFGATLLDVLGLPESTLLRAPTTSAEFITDLESFDIILAGRMHAGIVATALDMPVLGLIWSNKIELFSEITGIRSNYFDESELNATTIAQKLSDRSVTPVDEQSIAILKSKTTDHLATFIDGLR